MTCAIPNCERRARERGLCHAHYEYQRRTGQAFYVRPTPADRFWPKVNKEGPTPEHRPDLGPCWLWTATHNGRGYGRIGINYRMTYAYRFAYELMVGPIPADLELDHLCRNTRCVHPTHLEPVTRRENVWRGLRGVLKTHCPQGHPYNEANTYLDGGHHRRCRQCMREQRARYYLTRRQEHLERAS